MKRQFHTDSPEALAAINAPELKTVWIHGSITYVYTGEDYIAPLAATAAPPADAPVA